MISSKAVNKGKLPLVLSKLSIVNIYAPVFFFFLVVACGGGGVKSRSRT